MQERIEGTRRVTFGRRALYPMFIPYAIGFLTAAVVTDAIYWKLVDVFWARASMWLTAVGLVAIGVATLAALTDFLTIRWLRNRYEGMIPIVGSLPIIGVALASLILRIGDWEGAVLPGGVALSAIGAGVAITVGLVSNELLHRRMVSSFIAETTGRPAEERRRAA